MKESEIERVAWAMSSEDGRLARACCLHASRIVAAQLREQCDAFADERALSYAAAAGLILEGQDWQPGQGFAVENAGRWTRSGHPFAFDVGADEIAEAMRGAVPRSQQGDSQ